MWSPHLPQYDYVIKIVKKKSKHFLNTINVSIITSTHPTSHRYYSDDNIWATPLLHYTVCILTLSLSPHTVPSISFYSGFHNILRWFQPLSVWFGYGRLSCDPYFIFMLVWLCSVLMRFISCLPPSSQNVISKQHWSALYYLSSIIILGAKGQVGYPLGITLQP